MISGGMNGALTVILIFIGALLMVIGLFFIEVGIGALIFYIGWVLFSVNLKLFTDDFTKEDWKKFGCYFIKTVLWGLIYPSGVFSITMEIILYAIKAVVLGDELLATHLFSCE
jgi:hypothetical protein